MAMSPEERKKSWEIIKHNAKVISAKLKETHQNIIQKNAQRKTRNALLRAASLAELKEDYDSAVKLYLQAGEPTKAQRIYDIVGTRQFLRGQYEQAGAAYEAAGLVYIKNAPRYLNKAAESYKKAALQDEIPEDKKNQLRQRASELERLAGLGEDGLIKEAKKVAAAPAQQSEQAAARAAVFIGIAGFITLLFPSITGSSIGSSSDSLSDGVLVILAVILAVIAWLLVRFRRKKKIIRKSKKIKKGSRKV